MALELVRIIDPQEEVEMKALSIPDQAKSCKIVDDESYKRAGELLKAIKNLRSEINSTFDPIIKKNHDAHKEAIKQKQRVEEPLIIGESNLKPKMLEYQREQERKRLFVQKQLEEAAKKQAEDAQLEKALSAEKSGENAKADYIMNRPTEFVPVVFSQSAPKIDGICTKKNWDFEIIDESQIPREYLAVDEKKIRGVVRALKDKANIPGIRVYVAENLAVGRI